MNRVKEGMKNMAAKLAPQDDPNNFLNVRTDQVDRLSSHATHIA